MTWRSIYITTVDHQFQRYDTCGDWYSPQDNEVLIIRVSDLGDWRFNLLVALHEMIEAMLCQNDGVSEAAVDNFDLGDMIDADYLEDPGCDPQAPYHKQHMWADSIERLVGLMMNVAREQVNEAIMKLPEWKPASEVDHK